MNPIMTSSWSVRFELPRNAEKGREWSRNLSATVVCDTAERAAEVIRDAHEDAVIFAINHKGKDVTYVDALTAHVEVVDASQKCPHNRSYRQLHEPNDHGRCVHCAGEVATPSEGKSQGGVT